MAEERKTFVLYEYLLYFWKKKWLFVIIPLIVTILVAGAVYVLKHDKKFTGTATVFTGSVDAKDLTNPENIKARYAKTKSLVDVFVSEKGNVKFTLKGNSKEEVQQDLDQMMEDFGQVLQTNAKNRVDSSTIYLNSLDERVRTLKASLAMYNEKFDEENLPPDQFSEVTDLTTRSLEKLAEADERANKIRSDIVLFEQPKVLIASVGPSKTYIPQGIAIGIILGLILTVALLMLMKYLGFARKYYNHD